MPGGATGTHSPPRIRVCTFLQVTFNTVAAGRCVNDTAIPESGSSRSLPAGKDWSAALVNRHRPGGQNITVTVVDASGNPVPNYTGTIHFTSSDTRAGLPADYTFTAADQGKHTFQVTFKTPGAQTIRAADPSNSAVASSANVTVIAVAQVLSVGGLGQTTTAGTPQSVTVTLTDGLGNVVTGYVGTVHFTSSDGNALLPANYTFTAADQGKHTFQVTFKSPGSQSLTVTDTANSALTASSSLTVNVAAQVLA